LVFKAIYFQSNYCITLKDSLRGGSIKLNY
jgi:hypothetical protein